MPLTFDDQEISLIDISGSQLAVTNSQPTIATQPGFLVAGVDSSSKAKFLKLTDDSELLVSGSFTADIDVGALVSVGTPAVTNITQVVREKLANTGSTNLNVNGSVVNKEFIFQSDNNSDIRLGELRFILVANSVVINGSRFGPIPTLTNGVLIQVKLFGTASTAAVLQRTEDFLTLPTYLAGPHVHIDRTDAKEFIAASLTFGGLMTLQSASTDFVKVIVRDDLSTPQIQFFEAILYGSKTT